MNKVILIGRLTSDPEVRYSQGEEPIAVARYSLAVDRPRRNDGTQETDFISCVAFRKSAEFAEKYLYKGIKIAVIGHLRTGSYTNKDSVKVYTTDVVVESHEFAESKKNTDNTASAYSPAPAAQTRPNSNNPADGFMNIPDALDEDLPFN